MPPIEDDLVDLLNRALAAPNGIKLEYGDNRRAELERKRLYWARRQARQRARPDRFSYPPPIAIDQLAVRVRGGDLYIARAEVLNGAQQSGLAEKHLRPPEQPVGAAELAGARRLLRGGVQQPQGAAVAPGVAAINAIGNLSGYFGPFVMGWIKDLTGDFRWELVTIAACTIEIGRAHV